MEACARAQARGCQEAGTSEPAWPDPRVQGANAPKQGAGQTGRCCSQQHSQDLGGGFHPQRQWGASNRLYDLSICLKGITGVSEREKEIFHGLLHFPNGHNNRGRTRPNPGAWNIIQISHVHELSSAPFTGSSAGHWIGRGAVGT